MHLDSGLRTASGHEKIPPTAQVKEIIGVERQQRDGQADTLSVSVVWTTGQTGTALTWPDGEMPIQAEDLLGIEAGTVGMVQRVIDRASSE